jgi:hypothetical protein
MNTKDLIDAVRRDLDEHGFSMPMSKGRDTVARLLYGCAYSSVIAASNAGTLGEAKINDVGTSDIRTRYGNAKAELAVEVAKRHLIK